MRLILLDRLHDARLHFDPVALARPIFELRCVMTSLAEKLIAATGATDVACFVPDYMADAYREVAAWPVNDPKSLAGDDLLIVHGRVKAGEFRVATTGPSQAAFDEHGQCLYARISRGDLSRLDAASIDRLQESARKVLPAGEKVAAWNYTWDLVLANPEQLTKDFQAAGRSGIEGSIEEPRALRGSPRDVYVAPGVKIHPMVVIDAEHGPV